MDTRRRTEDRGRTTEDRLLKTDGGTRREPRLFLVGGADEFEAQGVVAGEDEAETKAKIKSREGWDGLTAVKTDRIVVIPAELICRPSPRLALTIEQLAIKFRPERF